MLNQDFYFFSPEVLFIQRTGLFTPGREFLHPYEEQFCMQLGCWEFGLMLVILLLKVDTDSGAPSLSSIGWGGDWVHLLRDYPLRRQRPFACPPLGSGGGDCCALMAWFYCRAGLHPAASVSPLSFFLCSELPPWASPSASCAPYASSFLLPGSPRPCSSLLFFCHFHQTPPFPTSSVKREEPISHFSCLPGTAGTFPTGQCLVLTSLPCAAVPSSQPHSPPLA